VSIQVGNKSNIRENGAVRFCRDDYNPSLLADGLEMGQSTGAFGRRIARALHWQDSASPSQNPDSSKEWMLDGRVATLNQCGVELEWDHYNDPSTVSLRDTASVSRNQGKVILRLLFPQNLEG
jgi:hypothetical protein